MLNSESKGGKMKNRVNQWLNTVIGCSVGLVIGHGLYKLWHYNAYRGMYEMWSAPWYTSILMYGAFSAAVIAVCLIIKLFIKNKSK